MKTKQIGKSFLALLGSLLLTYSTSGRSGTPSPLDVSRYPAAPDYESLFPDRVVPLDGRLSRKRRFPGDESFNREESLPATSPAINQLFKNTADGRDSAAANESHQGGYDTIGVVKQARRSEGKIELEYGPVEPLGMPVSTDKIN